MSLTSYRAAPPRDAMGCASVLVLRVGCGIVERDLFPSRFGGDLLSHVLRRSTIGAVALNCRVRDGIGCFARAMTTKPRRKRGVLVAPPTSAECGPWNEQRAVILWAHIILVPSLRCTALGPVSAVLLLTILQVRFGFGG